MQEKNQQERYTSSLIMLTAKAAEGCTSCVEGYKRVAMEAGMSSKDIELAISAGRRAHQKMLAANDAPSSTQTLAAESDAKIELVEGKEAEEFFQQVMLDKNVQVLDAYFQSQGYKPVNKERGMARLQLAERTCTQGYLPYHLDDTHFSWIDYHLGQLGVDLVGVSVDLTKKDNLAEGQLPCESVIVQQGQVVSGHACDMNSFWNCLFAGCGPSAVGCLTTGPGWWACAVTLCGVTATICCFEAGCC